MYIKEDGTVLFTPQNENHSKLLKYFKRRNEWALNRQFNDFKDNGDGTTTIFVKDFEVLISSNRLSEIMKHGKVAIFHGRSKPYPNISHGNGISKKINLHRFLMRDELERYEGFEDETGIKIVVNHINGDTLDNTDENLEVITQNENRLKHSLHYSKGFSNHRDKFIVSVSGRYVGLYDTEQEAKKAYKKAVQKEIKRLEKIRLKWLEER